MTQQCQAAREGKHDESLAAFSPAYRHDSRRGRRFMANDSLFSGIRLTCDMSFSEINLENLAAMPGKTPMEVKFFEDGKEPIHPRAYVASMRLANFKGHKDVEAHIFRYAYPEEELKEVAELDLVGPPDPDMPAELVAGATKEAALKCVLEAFTREEIENLARYLAGKYEEQIASLHIAPLKLPAPLGVGPLAEIPEGENSGFIKLDKAPGYNLPFKARAYYDLSKS